MVTKPPLAIPPVKPVKRKRKRRRISSPEKVWKIMLRIFIPVVNPDPGINKSQSPGLWFFLFSSWVSTNQRTLLLWPWDPTNHVRERCFVNPRSASNDGLIYFFNLEIYIFFHDTILIFSSSDTKIWKGIFEKKTVIWSIWQAIPHPTVNFCTWGKL